MASPLRPLGQREAKLVELIAAGQSVKEAAAGMGISHGSAKVYLQTIRTKRNCRSTFQVIDACRAENDRQLFMPIWRHLQASVASLEGHIDIERYSALQAVVVEFAAALLPPEA